ncbi:glycosyltransferase family 2 protein [Pseudomonas sp. NPDC088444]|uniref:glycosyltransferase family 2 protein n=1 Tax=Pseudomonas sp. NPDC088444 TaxID=3364456 RepID=UPI00384D6EEE
MSLVLTDAPAPLTVDAPLVSIIAPCYNAEHYLEVAIQSIFEQSYPNFEVIIVDDGSTDNSFELLKELQTRYSFQLYRQNNQGVSAALNHGLQHARGQYVATPDLDDIMLPESVQVRVDYLERHPNVGIVGALIIYMDPHGKTIKQQTRTHIQRFGFDQLLADAVVCGAPVALYRMDALKAAGNYDPQIKVQDFQITLRIAHLGYDVHSLPVIVTRYRRHPNNLSRRYKKMLEADSLAIAPYKAHSQYSRAHAAVINKALKYAVVEDKKDAFRLIRSIPFKHWNSVTFKRLKRLLTRW